MVLWDADSLRFKEGTSQGVAALNVVTAQGVRKAVSARNGNSRNMSELLVMVHNAKKNYGYPLVN